MPDFIAKCFVCEDWTHKDRLVDEVCDECREMAREKLKRDAEYSHYLTMFLKGEAPSIAPNGRYREIWTSGGRHAIRHPKEWTKLSRKQRRTLAETTGPLILPRRSRSRS